MILLLSNELSHLQCLPAVSLMNVFDASSPYSIASFLYNTLPSRRIAYQNQLMEQLRDIFGRSDTVISAIMDYLKVTNNGNNNIAGAALPPKEFIDSMTIASGISYGPWRDHNHIKQPIIGEHRRSATIEWPSTIWAERGSWQHTNQRVTLYDDGTAWLYTYVTTPSGVHHIWYVGHYTLARYDPTIALTRDDYYDYRDPWLLTLCMVPVASHYARQYDDMLPTGLPHMLHAGTNATMPHASYYHITSILSYALLFDVSMFESRASASATWRRTRYATSSRGHPIDARASSWCHNRRNTSDDDCDGIMRYALPTVHQRWEQEPIPVSTSPRRIWSNIGAVGALSRSSSDTIHPSVHCCKQCIIMHMHMVMVIIKRTCASVANR